MPKFWSTPSSKQFLPVLLHPLTLSVAATVLILLIFPLNIQKYQLKVTASSRNENQLMVFWEDLENDGISDKILMVNYKSEQVGIAVYFHPSGIVKEWNIPGELVNRYGNDFFAVGEPTGGADKEIFVFTQSHDSIFLNRLFNITGREIERLQTFISTVTVVNGDHDANIVFPRLEDLDNDGTRELVFGINTGFSVVPRALFSCNLSTNTIVRSIETGNSLINFLVADIAGDPDKEIVTMGYAPAISPTPPFYMATAVAGLWFLIPG
jgi:hypothetical protein